MSKLYFYGVNADGVFGTNDVINRSSPVQTLIKDDSWQTLPNTMLGTHIGVIKTNGSLWMWGANSSGQLGDTTIVSKSSPLQIGNSTNWWQLSCGARHTIALQSDRTLWAWGFNYYGQLGTVNTISQSSPVQIMPTKTWSYVAAGYDCTFAVANDGTLWGWGNPASGLLFSFDPSIRVSSPTQLSSDTTWQYIKCNTTIAAAIKNDNTLWVWGSNDYGQLGNDNYLISQILSPIQIGSYVDFSIGTWHVFAKKSNNTLWAWGSNINGTLGDNTQVDRSSPVQITNPYTTWSKAVAGQAFPTDQINYGVANLGFDNVIKQLYSWGGNYLGSTLGLFNTTPEYLLSPTAQNYYQNVIDAVAGLNFFAFLDDSPSLTRTPTPTPSGPTPSPTPTPSRSPTPTPTLSPTVTPSPPPSGTGTTPTQTPSRTPTPTPTPTPSFSPTPTPTECAGGFLLSPIVYSQSSVYSGMVAADVAHMQNGIFCESDCTCTDNTGLFSWIMMDFTCVYNVTKVVIGSDYENCLVGTWGPTFTEDRIVEYSYDGSDWYFLFNTGVFTSGIQEYPVDVNARYIRIRTVGYLCLTEFYAMGPKSPTPTPSGTGATPTPTPSPTITGSPLPTQTSTPTPTSFNCLTITENNFCNINTLNLIDTPGNAGFIVQNAAITDTDEESFNIKFNILCNGIVYVRVFSNEDLEVPYSCTINYQQNLSTDPIVYECYEQFSCEYWLDFNPGGILTIQGLPNVSGPVSLSPGDFTVIVGMSENNNPTVTPSPLPSSTATTPTPTASATATPTPTATNPTPTPTVVGCIGLTSSYLMNVSQFAAPSDGFSFNNQAFSNDIPQVIFTTLCNGYVRIRAVAEQYYTSGNVIYRTSANGPATLVNFDYYSPFDENILMSAGSTIEINQTSAPDLNAGIVTGFIDFNNSLPTPTPSASLTASPTPTSTNPTPTPTPTSAGVVSGISTTCSLTPLSWPNDGYSFANLQVIGLSLAGRFSFAYATQDFNISEDTVVSVVVNNNSDYDVEVTGDVWNEVVPAGQQFFGYRAMSSGSSVEISFPDPGSGNDIPANLVTGIIGVLAGFNSSPTPTTTPTPTPTPIRPLTLESVNLFSTADNQSTSGIYSFYNLQYNLPVASPASMKFIFNVDGLLDVICSVTENSNASVSAVVKETPDSLTYILTKEELVAGSIIDTEPGGYIEFTLEPILNFGTIYQNSVNGQLEFISIPNPTPTAPTPIPPIPASLFTWGNNYFGNLGNNSTVSTSTPSQFFDAPNPWTKFGRVTNTPFAIQNDGTLWGWGRNTNGQLGDETVIDKSSPIQILSSISTWNHVTSREHSMFLTTAGDLYVVGRNLWGELGNSDTVNLSSPMLVTNSGSAWAQVEAGGYFSAGIKKDGTLWTWGKNENGTLGIGTLSGSNASSPVQTVAGGSDWSSVSCGYNFAIAQKVDGSLYAWGANLNGQLGINSTSAASSPTLIDLGYSVNWVNYACGDYHAVACSSSPSYLWAWGINTDYQLGLGFSDTFNRSQPTQCLPFPIINSGTKVSAGPFNSAFIDATGLLYTCGRNDFGQCGMNNTVANYDWQTADVNLVPNVGTYFMMGLQP